MMRSTEIVFVRHGESTYNVAGRWQGQGDAPLSERGREQARALAARLGAERFDLIVASDLSRATDTARALGRPLERDPAWRELDVGAWEGLTREEVDARFPDQVRALQRGEPIRVGGGESWGDVRVRGLAALAALRERLGDGDRALVVAHGGLLLTLTSALLGVDERRPAPLGKLDNTALTRVRFRGDAAEVEVFNDATHLRAPGAFVAARLAAGDAVVRLVCRDGGAPPPEDVVALYEADDADLAPAIGRIAAAHPGAHVALLADGADIAATAPRLLGAPASAAALACPGCGGAAPLVVSGRGAAIAAWNLPTSPV
jgi:broad specificity phosphatase PhoE